MNTTTREISNSDDYIDVRDVIARFEELETEKETVREEHGAADVGWDNRDEFNNLRSLLDDLKDNGGDEQWRGDWYPITLIRDTYFVEAMRELVEDIGDFPKGFPSYIEVDWDKTADNLRADYGSVEFDGRTYWYR
jgi:hypothetical protein